MKPVFVDTSAWYALSNELDAHHAKADGYIRKTDSPLITTNYVIVETANLIGTRSGHRHAAEFLKMLRATGNLSVHIIDAVEDGETQTFFEGHAEKGYSFTDCSSFVIMRRLHLLQAFAFDRHFKQAGFSLVPPAP